MSSRRPLVLMTVLLALVFAYIARPDINLRFPAQASYVSVTEPPLPGENSISNLVVRQDDSGAWRASFDYYYTGEPSFVLLSARLSQDDLASRQRGDGDTTFIPTESIKRGSGSMTVALSHPGISKLTRQVIVTMHDPARQTASGLFVVASAQVEQLIDWPTWEVWIAGQEFARLSLDENLQRAIEWIDGGSSDQLARAKAVLERLIGRDPSMVQAYVELARVAMKSNWGPQGLHHAESLLSSALQIQPDHTNAKILKGYVYAHQERYKAAEQLFAEVAASNPPNLWLWANWGEVLAMQGRTDQAIAKYREAIERPATDQPNKVARADAYTHLLNLLEQKQDANGLEALYKKGIALSGENSCLGLSYSRFLLEQRSDVTGAIDLARKSLEVRCRGTDGRTALGLAYYVSWSKSEGADRTEALNQARIYLPPGAVLMYHLARNAKTTDVAAKLVAAGEKIDQKDNENLNALAHAIQNENLQAARRLLRLGAKTDMRVGYGDVPVALMPVMGRNIEMIELMQEYGADYAKLSYQGTTAFEFAKQTGDAELSEVLSRKSRTL